MFVYFRNNLLQQNGYNCELQIKELDKKLQNNENNGSNNDNVKFNCFQNQL